MAVEVNFAPSIEVELPSGSTLEISAEQWAKVKGIGDIINLISPDQMKFFDEVDTLAFRKYTDIIQENENRPVGANTPMGMAKVAEGQGVTDTSIPLEGQILLNQLANIEGGEYNIIVGGDNFQGFDKHPNIAATKKGIEGSTAAGRYQINYPTWVDIQKANPELTDFSPANQDKAAWWLAQKRYKSATGDDLLTDIRAGETKKISDALKGTWDALKKKKINLNTVQRIDEVSAEPTPATPTATDGVRSPNPIIKYDVEGKKRSMPLSPTLETKIATAVKDVFGEGYTARVYSGGQESNAKGEGTGSIRHNQGQAGDVNIIGPDGRTITDTAQLDRLKDYWKANKFGSVGTYMAGAGMHLDEWTEDRLLPNMGLEWSYGNG